MASPSCRLAPTWCVALALICLVLAGPAQAAAPNPLTVVDHGPQAALGAFAVARVANNAGTGSTWQLNGALVWHHNNGEERLSLSAVTISYPEADPPISSRNIDLAEHDVSLVGRSSAAVLRVGVFDGHDRDLVDLPSRIRFAIKYAEYSEPAVLEFNLAFRENTVPSGAFFFPAKQSDLPNAAWRYFYRRRHANYEYPDPAEPDRARPLEDQRWAHDIGVMRWNGSAWSDVKSSAESTALNDRLNTDYLIWGMPMYAMGDGVVVACYDGEVDHDPQDEGFSYEFGAGNHLEIDYGGDRVVLAHSQLGSIPDELCPGPDHQYHVNLNIPVRAGQYIGRVGNTGHTTNPHIHVHAYNEAADDTINIIAGTLPGGRGVPALFRNLRSVADQTHLNNLGQNPSYGQHDGKVLHRFSLFQPNPCGFPEIADDATEISFTQLTSECYQDMVNVATAKGWVPNIVDGYDVAGQARFNATFRPSTGASWTAYHDQTTAQMADLIDANIVAQRELHWIDAYKSGSEVRYAAVFFRRPGPVQDIFFDRSQAQWNTEFAQMSDAGYVPVNVAVVQNSLGSLRYTSVWERFGTSGWTLQLPTASAFSEVVASEEAAGRKPVYVNAFRVGSTPYVTGLFVAGMGGTTTKSVDVDAATLGLAIGANAFSDRPIRAVTGYDSGVGNPRFTAVWRSRIDTTITSGPANGSSTTSTTATFGFRAHHPFAIELECRKSSTNVTGSWLPCTSPRQYTGLVLGAHAFAVRATDRDLLTDPTPPSRSWTVLGSLPMNQAPVTSGIASRGHAEGTEVYVDVTAAFSDPDGDALALTTDSALPPDLDFQDGVFLGTFNFAADGVYPITITASDGKGGTVDASFTWTITDTNRVPTTSGIANQIDAEGATVNFDTRAAFDDPDGDGLTLSTASALPDGLSFGAGVFSGTLSFAASGMYPITITASDGKGGTVAAPFTWSVANTDPPVIIFISGFE